MCLERDEYAGWVKGLQTPAPIPSTREELEALIDERIREALEAHHDALLDMLEERMARKKAQTAQPRWSHTSGPWGSMSSFGSDP